MNNLGGSGHPYLADRQMQNLGESLSLMRIVEEANVWVAMMKLRNTESNPNFVKIVKMKAHSI